MGTEYAKKRIRRYIFLGLLCISLTLCFFLLLTYSTNNYRLKNDNSVLAFSSLTTSQKAAKMRSDEMVRAKLEFVYRGKVYTFEDSIVTPTDHLVAETIHNRKINASLDEKIRLVDRCLNAGASYKEALLYCFPLLENHVDSLKQAIDLEPTDSCITFNPNKSPMFLITKEKDGYEMIEQNVYRDAYFSLKRNINCVVSVFPKTLKPSVRAADNIKLTKLRASFSTSFESSQDNRCHNIELALSKINGAVLEPLEEFSFNKTVGRRTQKEGYLPAPIILQGEYTDGFGGGVCQVSTTLYNAAIRADMNITAVRNHSYPSSYVSPSFDAMVNSASSDLKFKNKSGGKVFIRAFVRNKNAIIEVYGKALPYRIKTESITTLQEEPPCDKEIIDTEYKYVDKNALPGTKVRASYGKGTLKSEGYLLFYDLKTGKLLERRLIRKDTYKSCPGIIAIAPETTKAPIEVE